MTVFFNDPNLINTRFNKIRNVGKEDLQRVAKTYLTEENRTVIATLPKARVEAALQGAN
jgi:zinc protease